MLVNNEHCVVIEEKDLITDMDIVMKFQNVQFLLRHDYAFGNSIYITNEQDVPILEKLANNVIDTVNAKIEKSQK
jgi:hypothetical protein